MVSVTVIDACKDIGRVEIAEVYGTRDSFPIPLYVYYLPFESDAKVETISRKRSHIKATYQSFDQFWACMFR